MYYNFILQSSNKILTNHIYYSNTNRICFQLCIPLCMRSYIHPLCIRLCMRCYILTFFCFKLIYSDITNKLKFFSTMIIIFFM